MSIFASKQGILKRKSEETVTYEDLYNLFQKISYLYKYNIERVTYVYILFLVFLCTNMLPKYITLKLRKLKTKIP